MNASPTGERPKLYSYIRFSTPEQRDGESYPRQLKYAQEFCAKHNLELVETLKDEGLSAHSGAHRKKGILGRFIELVRNGTIRPGSYLFVEDIDRLSREKITHAWTTIVEDLLKKDIIVATPEQIYTKESIEDPANVFPFFAKLQTGYIESAKKSKRLSHVWEQKKKRAREQGIPLTAKLPAWLEKVAIPGEFKDGKPVYQIKAIPDAVRTVRMIFELVPQLGRSRLVKKLNAEAPWFPPGRKLNTPTGGWRMSYVRKILSNRAVIGEYQPHKGHVGNRVPEGEPIANFYPAIISEDSFYAMQARLKANVRNSGRKGKALNLFSNLVKCAYCGGSMVFRSHGAKKNGHNYLQCDNGLRGRICEKSRRVRLDELQTTILNNCRSLRPELVLPNASESSQRCDSLRRGISASSQKIIELETANTRLLEQIEKTEIAEVRTSFLKRIEQNQAKRKEESERLDQLKASLETEERSAITFQRWKSGIEDLLKCIEPADAIDARLKLQHHLKDLISEIRVFTHGYIKESDPEGEESRQPIKGRKSLPYISEAYKQARAKHDRVEKRQIKPELLNLSYAEPRAYPRPLTDSFRIEVEEKLLASDDHGFPMRAPTLDKARSNPRKRFLAFLDYVMQRRLSKDGRFFRVTFKNGASMDLVPQGSLASGFSFVSARKPTCQVIRPDLEILWKEFQSELRKNQ